MAFKDLVKTFVGYMSLCSFIIMLAVLFIWPHKYVAGMGISIIALVTFLLWGVLGGFKNASN